MRAISKFVKWGCMLFSPTHLQYFPTNRTEQVLLQSSTLLCFLPTNKHNNSLTHYLTASGADSSEKLNVRKSTFRSDQSHTHHNKLHTTVQCTSSYVKITDFLRFFFQNSPSATQAKFTTFFLRSSPSPWRYSSSRGNYSQT